MELTRAKTLRVALVAAAAVAVCAFAPAGASAKTFFNGSILNFGEFNPNPSTAYPSTIAVSGESGKVKKVTANLNGFDSNNPGGGEVLLVGPTGAKAILMDNACGATAVTGLTFAFQDDAATVLPSNCVGKSGPFKPTAAAGSPENLPVPAPAGPYVASLAGFAGTAPNGTWQLFTRDRLIGGDSPALLGGWSLEIETTADAAAAAKQRCPKGKKLKTIKKHGKKKKKCVKKKKHHRK
jgi:hypothetical protein